MRIATAILVLCAISGAAAAEECKAIPKARARLECYDRQSPPTLEPATGAKQRKFSQQNSLDNVEAENARLSKKIGNICRGLVDLGMQGGPAGIVTGCVQSSRSREKLLSFCLDRGQLVKRIVGAHFEPLTADRRVRHLTSAVACRYAEQ